MSSQRDIFLTRLLERAKEDKDIYLISVDMGAPSLDRWREELPDQFFAAGISEQNAINFAAGLSANGKKVYVYFMACWVARCFEQIRYSCAMANNRITILGNGVGLGYAPAGPAHEPTEDLAYMRSLCGIEIYSPTNAKMTEKLVDLTCDVPKLRYIRLERKYPSTLDTFYKNLSCSQGFLQNGVSIIKGGMADPPRQYKQKKVCILSSGYMLGRALEVSDQLLSFGYEATVVDLWKIKPINTNLFNAIVASYDLLVTLEEQTLSGGFGSAIAEVVVDLGLSKQVLRIGLPERYIFENGDREHLLNENGLSTHLIYEKIKERLLKE
jgi:transketolase|tara:strand:- start:913 stop:1890 length:978 start_codon:yes stop_codon:yes gene_type:complete